MRNKRLAGWTAQRPIRLEGEVLSREMTRFPGQGNRRLAIALYRSLIHCGLCDRESKLGRAYRSRLQHMTQFQTEVPDPLRDDLPGFLPGGSVRTPSVGLLLQVLISKLWLKGPTMQIEGHDIGSGEPFLR